MTGPVTVVGVEGIGEVAGGSDLAELLTAAVELRDGDLLVVTSKVVSKAEGRVTGADKPAALAAETGRVVARRGPTSIVRTPLGLVMANAGIDASNTAAGTLVLLPVDPDGSARRIREEVAARTGANVAVLVTDTFGRPWRSGQTDVAIGAAGLEVLHGYAGSTDDHGNELAVTEPAVADEIAGAGDLVMGKVRRVPAAVVRGLGRLVLPAGQHGPGAAALLRPEAEDMFGYGAREAVVLALRGDPSSVGGFGRPDTAENVSAALGGTVVAGQVEVTLEEVGQRELGRLEATLAALAFAHGWLSERAVDGAGRATVLRYRPATS